MKKMLEPLISVIVPIYKTGDYLYDCFESLLSQDYPRYEIIAVLDGPDKALEQMVNEYQGKSPNVVKKVVLSVNSGLPIARNEGIKKSNGDYICFVDSDDVVDKNFLSELIKLVLAGNDIGLVGCYSFYEDGRRIDHNWNVKKPSLDINEFWDSYFSNDSIVGAIACNKIFPRKLFNSINFRKLPCEDEYLMNDYSKIIHKVGVSNSLSYGYRQRSGSLKNGKKETNYWLDRAGCYLERASNLIVSNNKLYYSKTIQDALTCAFFSRYYAKDDKEKEKATSGIRNCKHLISLSKAYDVKYFLFWCGLKFSSILSYKLWVLLKKNIIK